MKKIIGGPLAILLIPQSIVWSFWFLLRCLGLDSGDCRILMACLAALVLIISGGFAAALLSEWVPEYAREQRLLREQQSEERERLRRQIDEQIGIPHVPRVRS